ncbi:MAG: pyruvate kinase [Erysipelotrichaceae bacterium]|nr:pyruvate kinase [Erysipelotrichaceae bacterium]
MEAFKKTKMVCTIGPASEPREILESLIDAGMNVMRLNFSHGDFEEHGGRIKTVKAIKAETGKECAILLDTKGPEIRTGDFVNGVAEFKKGQKSVICYEDIEGTSNRFSITYKELYKDVKEGGIILVNDGQVELQVEAVEGKDIITTCLNNGDVKNKRGINVPGIKLGFDYLSEKDISDITFGCEQGINYVAASFVRRADDVLQVRELLNKNNRPDVQIIAKIENSEGVSNMDEILEVADGIMVARGDLGVEVPAEDVPLIQKELIKKCNATGKVVITATQMLESMQKNPRPTRAEVSDVANAIFDGSDAIMLSGESAQGDYPWEAVTTMAKVARKTETALDHGSLFRKAERTANSEDTDEAIVISVAEIANKFNVSAIVAFTESGRTAQRISRYRPGCPIIAATPHEVTVKRLALNWGVNAVICDPIKKVEEMVPYAIKIAKENGIESCSKILVTGGNPGQTGSTNFLNLVVCVE